MKLSKEEQFLKIIKVMPSVFVVVFSLFVILFLYFENKKTFNKERRTIEQKYILKNKEIIKEEVSRVFTFTKQLQKNTEEELKQNVKNRVYEAHEMATNIYEKYKTTKSKEEIFQIIKVALSGIRFNDGRGYFFIDDIYGNKLSHPIDTSIEGKNFLNYTDVNGYKFFENIVNTIKEKTERFDEYYWYKPNTNKEIGRKIAFYKTFEPLNIAIGTGEYFDDFEKIIQKKALDYINLVRFGKSGYIFIINYDGTYLNHIRKDYIGKNYLENDEVKDKKRVISDLINIAKNGNGFYTYIQNKPSTEYPTEKISFVQGMDDWNWLIGAGFYEDDLNQEIADVKNKLDRNYEKYALNILILGMILIIFLLVASGYVSIFLENKLKEYKRELDNKQAILYQQSKMAAMGEMIGNIAHQWRQPLSIITTATSGMVLQKQMGVLTDEFFFEASNRINTSSQYLSQTIDDFRNFFIPNKEKSKVNLIEIFKKTLDLISAQFSSKDIEIIKNIEGVEFESYENELIQALINILNNSRDELIKKDGERFIFVDAFEKDNFINIIIKDNAGGVIKENLNKIFEPYFTTKYKSQGTGIGLYMTEEIITKHLNGTICVENVEFTYNEKEYFGAQFTIRIDLNTNLE
ncbi:cache domain-containing protein [Aliarcobacter butzleri]|uniref:sensor histidine kinase n=1 Tax=Aliarcobacter butzleri TaxID=28197 RepID=UPI001EDE16AC|nr:cache domain-containing protein [Aliarcobacter butzleri]MCG3673989.1 cache domain-containing protein [Aliarcobacter butzleri]MCG3697174.1 cache domain-containing protein [Aliarcobacter butzleri]MCG3700328.1 cache domain-containing protein [Aliarcobacter butzleri]MCT7619283.1 cache domain-containing protein [Aliarcobacter butzleri]MDN5082738.1 cache domain-containing protein [Aliarcobacter butzleri]